jgi:O-methyltransferase involved in polyketide biosynthesis
MLKVKVILVIKGTVEGDVMYFPPQAQSPVFSYYFNHFLKNSAYTETITRYYKSKSNFDEKMF